MYRDIVEYEDFVYGGFMSNDKLGDFSCGRYKAKDGETNFWPLDKDRKYKTVLCGFGVYSDFIKDKIVIVKQKVMKNDEIQKNWEW